MKKLVVFVESVGREALAIVVALHVNELIEYLRHLRS